MNRSDPLTKFMRQLKHVRRQLTRQQLLTLRGQAITGDIVGAEKGLDTILHRSEQRKNMESAVSKHLTLGSLFDGSGGFPLGAVLSGIEPIWASEIEPFPIRVTSKRFPQMKHYGDISTMNGADIEPVDIITFGSPCTDRKSTRLNSSH